MLEHLIYPLYDAKVRLHFLLAGVNSKQIIPGKNPFLLLHQNPSFSFSKYSGLSAVQPAALLENKQFVVEPVTTRNVTTQVGMTTYLHCIVDKLEDKTVGGLQRQVKHVPLEQFAFPSFLSFDAY